MADLKKIILSNPINAKIFSLNKEVYIVGGYLRDILSKEGSKDIDYIVRGDIKAFASRLLEQKLLKDATLVELKKEMMVRIVLKDGSTLDFTALKSSLQDNLRERDFTMNALAWSPTDNIIDPLLGLIDIKKKMIKAVSTENLMNDPLRLLRVYRFASEPGWKVEPKTRKMVTKLKAEIKRSAPERITLEFFKLLNSEGYQNALQMALDDGLIEIFISSSSKKLADNIKKLPNIESQIKKLPPAYKRSFGKPFSQELTYHGLLRLEQILSGSILSENRLRLSRSILERLRIVNKLLFTASKMFDTCLKAKDAVLDILILTGNTKLFKHAERCRKIGKKSFLSAEEIMKLTGLKTGVELGKLIYSLKKMEFEGKIKTKKQAVKILKSR